MMTEMAQATRQEAAEDIYLGRQPIVDREKMYGDDPRNDPYRHDFDPNRKDRT